MTASLINYLAFLGLGLSMLACFMALYQAVTPYNELRMIREGNVAAALSFGGAFLGFTLTLASSAISAARITEFLIWSAVAGVVQLLAFVLAAYAIKQVRHHMTNGNVAVGAAMMFFSIAVGVINAAALT